MNERDKIDAAVAHLRALKVTDGTAAPSLWRLSWRAGLFIPPPHFLGFFSLALLTGLSFGIVVNLLIAVFLLVTGKPVAWPVAVVGLAGALVFGLSLASFYRWSAARLELPLWSEFCPDFDTADDSW